MCRMYASVGATGPPAQELLAFRGLCTSGCGGPHGDGWGMVGYRRPGAPEALGKSVAAAALDKGYEEAAARAPRFPVVVAHLRKASSGPKTLDNTHPFVMGGWAFAHNGTISGGYPEKVAPGAALNDSRVLFQQVHAALRGDPAHALRAAIAEVKDKGFPFTSITVLLTDGQRIWAAREVRKSPDEYDLRWQARDGRVVLCQEPILPGAWSGIPNGSLAVADARGILVEPL